MKGAITIILFFISVTVFCQNKQDTSWKSRLNNVEYKLNEVEKKNYDNEIRLLKDKVDFQKEMNEQSSSGISNQLGSASYNLSLFGLLFAIAVIGLGIYVTYIERTIVKIGEENKELLNKNQKIKEDVEALNKLIQGDINNLFLKIKREESVHILERLVKVPKDISNVSESLLSRELEEEDFGRLRQAYLNLGDTTNEYQSQYNIVFFQHFLGKSLQDERLRQPISKFIPDGILSSFENDIVKSTSEFATAVVDKGIPEFKEEINLFFNGLTNSEFKTFSPVYQVLFDNLKSRRNRFEIFNVVESVPDKRQAKIEFGKLLEDFYANDNPTESELLVYAELNELLAAHQNAENEAQKKAEAK